MIHGVDVSEWQECVAWEKLQPGFAIIRAGHGASWDEELGTNVQKAERLGIPWGVYWCHENGESGYAEAVQAMAPWSGSRYPKLGIWFDVEPDINLDAATYEAAAFCREIERGGYYAGIYGCESVLDELDLPEYDRWTAAWGSNNGQVNDAYKPDKGTLWQYTSKLIVDGHHEDGDTCLFEDLSFYDLKPKKNKDGLLKRLARVKEELDSIMKELKEMLK